MSHGTDAEFRATLTPCTAHFEAGMEPLELIAGMDEDVAVTLGCGCRFEHLRDGPTRLILCQEDLEEYFAVLERAGLVDGSAT